MRKILRNSIVIIIFALIGWHQLNSESIVFKQSKVRIMLPTNWKYEYVDDEMIATPADSDLKLVFVTTGFKSLESAYQDAILGFEKIIEKREFEINGMPAIYFKARDMYDVNDEYRAFDWLYILFKSPSGYVVTMCGGADTRSDVFFKYYIDINMIYKTFKPTEVKSDKKSKSSK